MNTNESPLVSVVTPVYNGADFLEACIESILAQTYSNFEYVIVNNRSEDRTLEIARSYAKKDRRIRVHDNETFVGVMENHNIAVGLISPASKYCKLVAADDWIFPECLAQMVTLAEANPSVVLVGTYMLAGKQVMNAGLEYDRKVVKGRDICRATLLGGPYVFGSPTSLLYRADLVRKKKAFYPSSNPHSDTTACYEMLEHGDFGFVHQVLAGAQIHEESQTSRSIKYGTIRRALIADLARFGPAYLTPEELDERLNHLMGYYYRWLVGALIKNRADPKFWPTQRAELEEAGIHVSYSRLCGAVLQKGVDALLQPRWAMQKLWAMSGRDPRKIEAQYY